MTNEEAMVFMDNLMICINEHPVVADWLIEIANRKDEPQITVKQTSPRTEVKTPYDLKTEMNNIKAIKDLQEHYGIKQEPTLSEMFKDEPQTLDMFALDMAIAKCKVRHNNCKNCDKKCVFQKWYK